MADLYEPGDTLYVKAEYVKAVDYVDGGLGYVEGALLLYVEGAMLLIGGKSICVRADALEQALAEPSEEQLLRAADLEYPVADPIVRKAFRVGARWALSAPSVEPRCGFPGCAWNEHKDAPTHDACPPSRAHRHLRGQCGCGAMGRRNTKYCHDFRPVSQSACSHAAEGCPYTAEFCERTKTHAVPLESAQASEASIRLKPGEAWRGEGM